MIHYEARSGYVSGTMAYHCYKCWDQTDGWLCGLCAMGGYDFWTDAIGGTEAPLLEDGDRVPDDILRRIFAYDFRLGMRIALRETGQ